MKQDKQIDIHFEVEAADRSVGIMSEGFSAWVPGDDYWVSLDDIVAETFTWYDSKGEEIKEHSVLEKCLTVSGSSATNKPAYANLVEKCLAAYANAWYDRFH